MKEEEKNEWHYRGISVSLPPNIGPSEWLTLRAYIELFKPQNAIWKEKPVEAVHVGGGTKVCDKCQRIHPVGADCPIVFAVSNPVAPEMH